MINFFETFLCCTSIQTRPTFEKGDEPQSWKNKNFILGVSFLIHLRYWFFNSSWSQKCKRLWSRLWSLTVLFTSFSAYTTGCIRIRYHIVPSDNTVREYTLEGMKLELKGQFAFPGIEALRISIDSYRRLVLLQDWNAGDSKLYATNWFETGTWSEPRKLALRPDTQVLAIRGVSTFGTNMIALFEENSMSLMIYKYI